MSAPAPIITVQGVGKRFRLRPPGGRTLKTWAIDALRPGRSRTRDFWALQDISVDVHRGETLGIIGANGAGKSTLLSLLAGTKTPTTGTIRVAGSVSSLLELGAGFHPDLTGRENVFLFGAVMGIPRERMRARFDAIVAFAGLGDFIDQPVRHYSSGMYVRLGFAVAVEVDPDVLLIDEVLAVGDAAFQARCIERMRAFRAAGKTMLIISHDMNTIRSVSDRILFLEAGRMHGLGSPDSLVEQYRQASRTSSAHPAAREWGTGGVRICTPRALLQAGPDGTVPSGAPLEITFDYAVDCGIAQPVFGFAICDAQGRTVFGTNTQAEGVDLPEPVGRGRMAVRLESLPLSSGLYTLSLAAHSWDHLTQYHRLDHWHVFEVTSERGFEGVRLPSRWRAERHDSAG